MATSGAGSAYLHGLHYEVGEPRPIEPLRELISHPATIDAMREAGVHTYRHASRPLTSMLASVIRKTLEATRIDRVDAVVLSSGSREWKASDYIPALAQAGVHDVPVHAVSGRTCANATVALREASDRIARQGLDRVLVVTADETPCPAQRPNRALYVLGDGVTSCLVSSELGDFELLCDCQIDLGSAPESGGLMNKLEWITAVRKIFQSLLDQVALARGDLRAILSPNLIAAPDLLQLVGGLDETRLYSSNVTRLGHIGCADPLINLADAARHGLIRTGDHFLSFATSWNSATAWCMRRMR